MADKTIRYELVGANVEVQPYSVTGKATLRLVVRTKTGLPHVLLIRANVQQAPHLRNVLNGLCAKFKELAAQLYNSL